MGLCFPGPTTLQPHTLTSHTPVSTNLQRVPCPGLGQATIPQHSKISTAACACFFQLNLFHAGGLVPILASGYRSLCARQVLYPSHTRFLNVFFRDSLMNTLAQVGLEPAIFLPQPLKELEWAGLH